jgi:peptidyl-prolyl cis-trans isomerase SurA
LTRRYVAVPVAIAAALLAVAGCSPQQAGSAATIGSARITTKALDLKVQDLHAALKGAEPQSATAAKTVSYVLQTLITNDLIVVAATKNGVTVKPTEVAAARAALESSNGGKAGLDKLAANQGIPPSQIDSILYSNAAITALGKKLVPNGTAAQQQTAVKAYLVKLSKDLNTSVSPRYGKWDGASLSIVAAPNSVSSARPSNS